VKQHITLLLESLKAHTPVTSCQLTLRPFVRINSVDFVWSENEDRIAYILDRKDWSNPPHKCY
jgi:hypothetical protein